MTGTQRIGLIIGVYFIACSVRAPSASLLLLLIGGLLVWAATKRA